MLAPIISVRKSNLPQQNFHAKPELKFRLNVCQVADGNHVEITKIIKNVKFRRKCYLFCYFVAKMPKDLRLRHNKTGNVR